MATRGTITLMTDDGLIKSIYHHWDSYPEHLGRILLDHYTTEEAVDALTEMGDCSTLGPTLSDSSFYHRDHGEDLCVRTGWSTDLKAVVDFQDWNYVFENGKWTVF